MERYNFLRVEKKWQAKDVANSVIDNKSKKKILLFRNVSLSIWKDPYGTCKKLHYW